jgi:hypothetical protein
MSALGTGRFYPPGDTPGTHFYYNLSRPQGHSAAGKIKSIKNLNVAIAVPHQRGTIYPSARIT